MRNAVFTVQILAAQNKVAETRSWKLKLEVSQGKQKAELYEVEVMQSLGHEYKLLKADPFFQLGPKLIVPCGQMYTLLMDQSLL